MKQTGTDAGNQSNIHYLSEAYRRGILSHAYILEGDRESGKEAFAEDLAAALLCQRNQQQFRENRAETVLSPCGSCPSCIKARTGNHPDIISVRHEKESVLSVGEIREQVVEDIAIKPYYGPYKIYIIRDAGLMNENAQNALLKTIEEPAPYGLILLLTENADGFLQTIRSRCIRIRMPAASREDIAARLLDENGIPVLQMLQELSGMNALQIDQRAKEYEAADRRQVLQILQLYFRDVLVQKCSGEEARLYFVQYQTQIRQAAKELSYENLQQILQAIEDAGARIQASVKAEAAFETLLLSIRRCLKGTEHRK